MIQVTTNAKILIVVGQVRNHIIRLMMMTVKMIIKTRKSLFIPKKKSKIRPNFMISDVNAVARLISEMITGQVMKKDAKSHQMVFIIGRCYHKTVLTKKLFLKPLLCSASAF